MGDKFVLDLIGRVRDGNEFERSNALREIKNKVIGCPRHKLLFITLSLPALLVSLLRSRLEKDRKRKREEDEKDREQREKEREQREKEEVVVLGVEILGSLAYGSQQNVQKIVEVGGLSLLWECIDHRNKKVCEGAVRGMRYALFSSCSTFEMNEAKLSSLLKRVEDEKMNPNISCNAALLLSSLCNEEEHRVCTFLPSMWRERTVQNSQRNRKLLLGLGALSRITPLLSSPRSSSREAALILLDSLSGGASHLLCALADQLAIYTSQKRRENTNEQGMGAGEGGGREGVEEWEEENQIFPSVLSLLRRGGKDLNFSPVLVHLIYEKLRDKAESCRLAACSVLVNLLSTPHLPKEIVNLRQQVEQHTSSSFCREIQTVLYEVLQSPKGRVQSKEKAAVVTAKLFAKNMHNLRPSSPLLDKIVTIIREETTSPTHLAACYLALQFVPPLIQGKETELYSTAMFYSLKRDVQSPEERIRWLACCCGRQLSKSTKKVRERMQNLLSPLFVLLGQQKEEALLSVASGVVVNVVLGNPLVSEQIQSSEMKLRAIQSLLTSNSKALKKNGLWLLKNMSFYAKIELRSFVCSVVGLSFLLRMIREEDDEVVEQAVALFRNIVFKGSYSIQIEIDKNNGFVKEIVDTLVQKIKSTEREEIQLHSLYAISNISSHPEGHWPERFLEQEQFLPYLCDCLQNQSTDIVVAALWCLVNLTWAPGKEREKISNEEQIQRIIKKLHSSDSVSRDVSDRAATVMEQIRKK